MIPQEILVTLNLVVFGATALLLIFCSIHLRKARECLTEATKVNERSEKLKEDSKACLDESIEHYAKSEEALNSAKKHLNEAKQNPYRVNGDIEE
jgi:hypothetical protein